MFQVATKIGLRDRKMRMNEELPQPSVPPTTVAYRWAPRPIGIQTMVAVWQEKLHRFGPQRPADSPPVESPTVIAKTSTAATKDGPR